MKFTRLDLHPNDHQRQIIYVHGWRGEGLILPRACLMIIGVVIKNSPLEENRSRQNHFCYDRTSCYLSISTTVRVKLTLIVTHSMQKILSMNRFIDALFNFISIT